MTQNQNSVSTPKAVKTIDEAKERIKKINQNKKALSKNTAEAQRKRGY